MVISRRIVLHFPPQLVDQPIIYRLVKDFDIQFNILKASVTPREEGVLVLELSGEKGNYDRGMEYLAGAGVEVQPLSRDVIRHEEKCTHCGACVTICPAGAFEMDASTKEVNFLQSRCIACGLCIKPCPPRAMEMRF